jgi:mannose-1-phosphate guanylyltransferase
LQELTHAIVGAPIPKQYCRLLGEQSLLEATLARVRHFAAPERTMVVIDHSHLDIARTQVATLATPNVLIQPCNRDTGPGLLFALLALARAHPTATVAVFPSDHYVDNDPAFIRHVERSARIVVLYPDKIALLGIQPDRADPGFGYIVPTEPVRTGAEALGAFHVSGFWEKPSPNAACDLVAQKGLWNSFVMVFRLARMLDLLQRLMPAEFAQMRVMHDDPDALVRHYPSLSRWNFSTQVLARIPEHLVVLRVDDVYWNDWGTRESIERTLETLHRVPPWVVATPVQTATAEQGMSPCTAP